MSGPHWRLLSCSSWAGGTVADQRSVCDLHTGQTRRWAGQSEGQAFEGVARRPEPRPSWESERLFQSSSDWRGAEGETYICAYTHKDTLSMTWLGVDRYMFVIVQVEDFSFCEEDDCCLSEHRWEETNNLTQMTLTSVDLLITRLPVNHWVNGYNFHRTVQCSAADTQLPVVASAPPTGETEELHALQNLNHLVPGTLFLPFTNTFTSSHFTVWPPAQPHPSSAPPLLLACTPASSSSSWQQLWSCLPCWWRWSRTHRVIVAAGWHTATTWH